MEDVRCGQSHLEGAMEDFRTIVQKTLNEVTESLARTDPRQFLEFLETLAKRRSVLVTGDGPCAGVARAFANALVRLGMDVRVVGESTTLGVKIGDVLVVVTESGSSAVMADRVKAARNMAATVVVLTADARSKLLVDAQVRIILPGPTRTAVTPETATASLGLVFAEAAMLYLDAAVRALAGQVSRRDWREPGATLD